MKYEMNDVLYEHWSVRMILDLLLTQDDVYAGGDMFNVRRIYSPVDMSAICIFKQEEKHHPIDILPLVCM